MDHWTTPFAFRDDLSHIVIDWGNHLLRTASRRTTTALAGAALLFIGASCSSSDGGDAALDDGDRSAEAERTTTTEADPAAEVQPEIEDLLDDYGDVVNQIIAEPSVAKDPDHRLMAEYAGLFTPDSEQVAQAVAGWSSQADAGTIIEPINAEHPAVVSRLDGPVQLTSEDEARFPTCDEHRYLQLDAQGQVQDLVESLLQHGEGVAVRIDGSWRLRELRIISDGSGCQTTSEGGT